jgi:uncharacterized membrane protein
VTDVKASSRHAILLFAGLADLVVGIYALALVLLGIIPMQESWVLPAASLAIFTGSYLTGRSLAALRYARRGKAVPILWDERTTRILQRAGWNAFVFLVVALPAVVGLLSGMSKLGIVLDWNELAATMITVWVVAIVIFDASFFRYNRT